MRRMIGFLILMSLVLLSGEISASAYKYPAKRLCISPSTAEKYITLASIKRNKIHLTNVPSSPVSVNGNIFVIEASSELLIFPNAFDLKDRTIRFQPASQGKYTYNVLPGSFNSDASTTISLGDDDSYELALTDFRFPFAGKPYDRLFINSNGNITFEIGDPEPPDAKTLLAGPPRIAPFFADLDPEASGTIFLTQSKDRLTISWLKVPEFFNNNQFGYGENTFQVVLYSNGMIDLNCSKEITATQAVTGIIAGKGNGHLKIVDFSENTSRSRPNSSILEDFRNYESVDIPALMGTVFRNNKDEYDFVTLFSNFDLTPIPGVQAFAINVQNDVKGIGDPSGKGKPIFSDNKKYGSAKRLQNITFLGNLREYPSDPNRDLQDTYTSVLEILAHEVGHRWLSYIKISRDGASSGILLGRLKSHWSFFLDSDGSFLEGNQLQQSGSSFSTSSPFTKYSDLDLYLMGLLSADEVHDSYVVDHPSQFSPNYSFAAESSPEPGVKFKGSAVPVRISDVIAENGTRSPDAASSPKKFQHLFVLIVKKENPATAEDLGYLEMIRAQWERYFSVATGGRAEISTGVK
jgi:hypothetical protein